VAEMDHRLTPTALDRQRQPSRWIWNS